MIGIFRMHTSNGQLTQVHLFPLEMISFPVCVVFLLAVSRATQKFQKFHTFLSQAILSCPFQQCFCRFPAAEIIENIYNLEHEKSRLIQVLLVSKICPSDVVMFTLCNMIIANVTIYKKTESFVQNVQVSSNY